MTQIEPSLITSTNLFYIFSCIQLETELLVLIIPSSSVWTQYGGFRECRHGMVRYAMCGVWCRMTRDGCWMGRAGLRLLVARSICRAQPSPAQPQVQMSQKAQVSARASSPQPLATMLPHIWSLTSNIDQLKFCCWKELLSLNLVKILLYLISWSYKTIFPYSNIFSWCPHILTQVNVFSNLSKYLMIEYEVALKNTPESIERIDCVLH